MTTLDNTIRDRRNLLKINPAPQPRHDAVVTHRAEMGETTMRLRYVPDRDILSPDSLATYLDTTWKTSDVTLEETAQTILEDINDQIIPSWLEVTLNRRAKNTEHDVQIEDRQPHWKDRGLLDRLAP